MKIADLLEASSAPIKAITKLQFISKAKSLGIFSQDGLTKLLKSAKGQSLDNLLYDKNLNWLVVGDVVPRKYETAQRLADGISDMIDGVLGSEFEKQSREDAGTIEKIKTSILKDISYEKDAAAKAAVFAYWFRTGLEDGGMKGLSLEDWRYVEPSKLKIKTHATEHISRAQNASVWTYTADAALDLNDHHFTATKVVYKSDVRGLN